MYSYSRLETFEQCPRKYKFRYVDKLKTETEGVEAFVGKRVHETLERLYKDLKVTKLNSLDDLQRYYEGLWEKNWHAQVRIVQPGFSPGHYFELGKRCIADYYRHYYPFNHGRTLGLEERIELKLKDGDRVHTVQGYMDRLTWVPETETYEIHDYKTGNTVPTQEEADADRQLALYHLGILQRWPGAKNVRLIWHYLVADKEIVSTRKPEDLQALERDVVESIRRVEAEQTIGKWDIRTSRLCDWCEFKPICPAWKHPVAMEAIPVNEYLKDTGVQLVQKYSALEAAKADHQVRIKAIEEEQRKVEEAAIQWAKQEGVSVIDGPDHRLLVREEDDFRVPRKGEDPFAWELLRTTLKNAGKLEEVSTVNANMLKFAIKKGKWPADVVKAILGLVTQGMKRSVSLIKK